MADNTAHMERLKAGMSGDLNDVPGHDPTSLEKAAAEFKLDPTDPSQLLLLARLLADLQFGERKRGRQKGDKSIWNEQLSDMLVFEYFNLMRLHPKARDSDITKLICKQNRFSHFNEGTLRQKLTGLRETYKSWADDSEVWNSVWED
jgi:hypothetical protein